MMSLSLTTVVLSLMATRECPDISSIQSAAFGHVSGEEEEAMGNDMDRWCGDGLR